MNDIATIPNTSINQWDPESGAALPAYLADALGDLGTNINDRMTVPSLSYEGKTWTIVKDGNRTKLEAVNGDGDTVPVPIMRVILLNYNAERGRAYYKGTYNPAAAAAPSCWSADGKAPDPSVAEKQSPLCTGCPLSIKGSKVQDGKEMVACSSHRMIAVVPAFDILSDPLRLKIAVTSDYDKEIVDHGWYALRQYTDFLKSRGMGHTGLVVTKIKFDNNVAYPKLLFALDRVLQPEEVGQVKIALANPKVADLLAEKWTAAGAAGTLVDNSDIAPQPDLQTTQPASEQVITQPPSEPKVPKPTDAAHIAHAGTPNELWWNGSAWVTPWEPEVADTPAPPPPPPPAPEPEPVAVHDPRAAALADGWVQHPDSPPHGYKGKDVVDWATIDAMYPAPGNAASAATSNPSAGSTNGVAASDPAAATDTMTATPTASPSDLSEDVKALLGKWGG